MGGLLTEIDHSPKHVPIFLFILAVCAAGLGLWTAAPPRPAPLEHLEEALLSSASDCASDTSSRRPNDEQP